MVKLIMLKTYFFFKYTHYQNGKVYKDDLLSSRRGCGALSAYSSRFITFLKNDLLSAGVRFMRRVEATH